MSSEKKYYAGVGARKVPEEIGSLMEQIAFYMGHRGYVLRSGGSPGADERFEKGCGDFPKEIYLPHEGFRDNPSPHYLTDESFKKIKRLDVWAFVARALMAEAVPISIDSFPEDRQRLFARDVYQVLGEDLQTPSESVIYWKPEDELEGTRVTLYIADYAWVPTEDLSVSAIYQKWLDKVS